MRVLSAATREAVRSSATPAGAAVETSHRYATLWMFCTLLRRRGLNPKRLRCTRKYNIVLWLKVERALRNTMVC